MKKSSATAGWKPPQEMKRPLRRLWLLLTVLLVCSVYAEASGQRMSIQIAQGSLDAAFRQIMQDNRVQLVYNTDEAAGVQCASCSFEQAEVGEILGTLLEGTRLEYRTVNGVYVVSSRAAEEAEVPAAEPAAAPQEPAQATVSVQGVVLDETGAPLPGATVLVLADNVNNTLTDAEGRFVLRNVAAGAVLQASFLGYETQELPAVAGREMAIAMRPSATALREVVVTGIFDKKKSSYTGAVKVISDRELELFRGRNIFTTLKNIDPSINLIENNSWGADPNRLPEIQIRGAGNIPSIDQLQEQQFSARNTPLVIMDGFETTLARMMDLNEHEIASISILKDGAATALYGSRGANGIIVITTKKPQAGKLRLSVRADAGVSLPDLSSYDLLHSADKLELERLSGYYGNPTMTPQTIIGLQQYYNEVLALVAAGVDTDWLAKPLRTGTDQNYHVKLEGGSEAFQYAISAQYKTAGGVMKGSGRQTFNGGIDLTYEHKTLLFRNSLLIGNTASEESPYGGFSEYAKLNPYWQPYDAQGNVVRYFEPYNATYWAQTGNVSYDGRYANPMYNATLNTYNRSNALSITNNFAMEWRPLADLFFRGSLALTQQNSSADNFKPAGHSDFVRYTDAEFLRRGSYAYSTGNGLNYAVNLSANYSKVFAEKHHFFAGVNADLTSSQSRNYSFMAEGFPDETIDFLGSALQYWENSSPQGGESTIRRVGVLANASYHYDNRYLLDATYRVDGSSIYGNNNRFAPFWSVGVGWNLHNEQWLKERVSFIDQLRLRASYGTVGSNDYDPYQAQATYRYYTDDQYHGWVGAHQIALGNTGLRWQERYKFNAGMEVGVLNNRLVVEADVYNERTDRLLSTLELPYANGFTSFTENVGKLSNYGFELSATAWLIQDRGRHFSWSVTGNLAHDRDKVVQLSEALKAENERLALGGGSNPNRILREGASQNTIYAVQSEGIDPSTGIEVFRTKDGEITYTWSALDRVAVGNSMPAYRGNFSTMVRYGDFTLNLSFGYHFGGQLYNSTLRDKVEVNDKQVNVDARVFSDRWLNPGDKVPFRGLNDFTFPFASSRFVQDDNTLVCQNISLRYDAVGKQWLHAIGAQYLSATLSTGELFYLSTVKRERGTEYPFTRSLLLSLSLTF